MTHTDEIWLIYLRLDHIYHYLSTTKIGHTGPELTSSLSGETTGNTSEIRRSTGSTEWINDLAPEVISSSRMTTPIFTPTLGSSQGTPEVLVSVDNDIFANIQHVPGDFMLLMDGELKTNFNSSFFHQFPTMTNSKP
jgi:hypothetical protein